MLEKIKKYKYEALSIVVIMIIMFFGGYYIYVSVATDNNSTQISQNINEDSIATSKMKANDTINFLIKYNNCNDFIEDIKMKKLVEKDKEKLIGLKESELEAIFKEYGYKLDKLVENEINFIKEIAEYEYQAGSYFIGISGENVVIYNKKSDGNIVVVQNSIEDVRSESGEVITLDKLKDKGNLIDTLYLGRKQYEFTSKEEAIEYAKALCS